jgi:3-deoxy-D-manno-octulosonic-acid transferase
MAYPFSTKAKLWVEGRKQFPQFNHARGFKVWFHCASLGEFEQARPLIEKIKEKHPSCKIILSFFSPSGYEVRKNYSLAEKVVYLPLDTPKNAHRFIAELQPNLVMFVKYEFWFHFLNELSQKQIPTILFSSVFRNKQIFFRWYGGLFRLMLQKFNTVFVQDEKSKALLQTIGITSFVANDTRFDRVSAIAKQKANLPLIELFKGNSKLLIAGSTWQKDEEMMLECMKRSVLKGYKFIIAPHELHRERLVKLKRSISANALFYSELTIENATEADVVIIDNFGMLASLYRYGEIAYVGGGFNAGVHNILEAAAHGLPVVFGPNYHKAVEAKELVMLKGAFTIDCFESLQKTLFSLSTPSVLQQTSGICYRYVIEHNGGTDIIYNYLYRQQFLPKD